MTLLIDHILSYCSKIVKPVAMPRRLDAEQRLDVGAVVASNGTIYIVTPETVDMVAFRHDP